MLRALINSQVYLSRVFDRLLPAKYRTDGNLDFLKTFAPKYLHPNLRIYDVGGGKHPYISRELKEKKELNVIGLDIDAEELRGAPPGAYDEVVCADITKFRGHGDADLVICQAVLEHVRNTEEAFAALASMVKPGGRVLIFVPSRNAVFARINLLLPERLKRKILYTVYPQSKTQGGFPSYYDRCTPRSFAELAGRHDLEVEEKRAYYCSNYFTFLFPVHVAWRLWVLLFHLFAGEQAAETFSMSLRKRAPVSLPATGERPQTAACT